MSNSFPCYLGSRILDSTQKMPSVCPWHTLLLQNMHRLKHLPNQIQCFMQGKSFFLGVPCFFQREVFSFRGFFFITIMGEWKQQQQNACFNSGFANNSICVLSIKATHDFSRVRRKGPAGLLVKKPLEYLFQEHKYLRKLVEFTGWNLYSKLKWIWNFLEENKIKTSGYN